MHAFSARARLTTIAMGLVPVLATVALVHAQSYTLIDLSAATGDDSRAYAINRTGQVVGTATVDGSTHSMYWHHDAATDLHGTVHLLMNQALEHTWPYYTEDYSIAYAISNAGQVAGGALTQVAPLCTPPPVVVNAFILQPGVLTDLGSPYPGDALTNLGTFGHPCAALDSGAVAISNRNHVVGWADVDGRGTVRAFIVTPVNGVWYTDPEPPDDPGYLINNLLIDLGTMDPDSVVSSATAVNDAGQVAGYCYVRTGFTNPATGREAGYHAFLATPLDTDADGEGDLWYVDVDADGGNDLMEDLGTLGGNNSWGRGINNAGQVVGESDAADFQTTHAFLWENGEMTDLGTLGGDNSSASRISDDGVIVGWAEDAAGDRRAVVWVDGVIQDLNTLLIAETNLLLVEARDINERGQIVGWGLAFGNPGDERAFLLAPSDLPPFSEDDTEPGGTDDGSDGGTDGTANDLDLDPLAPDVDDGTDGSPPADDGADDPAGSAAGVCGAGTLTLLPLTLASLVALRLRGLRRRIP